MNIRTILVALLGTGALLAVIQLVVVSGQSGTPFWLAVALAGLSVCALALAVFGIAAPLSRLVENAQAAAASKGGDIPLKQTGPGEFAALFDFVAALWDCKHHGRQAAAEKDALLASIKATCDDSILQAQEASRLAEQSRAENLIAAASKLEEVVRRVMGSAGSLSNQMERISEGADMQRQRMVETSSSMGEMNSAILDISRSSSEASTSVERSKEYAVQSAAIARDAVGAIAKVNEATTLLKQNMNVLGEQAKSVDRVINVINDIADQTNLLALNAAIEAARAGEAGRGFSVVADEVRKLAEKTMLATKEVGQSINAIQDSILTNVDRMDQAVNRADEAAAMAGKAGDAAQEILLHTEDNTGKIHAIAAASEEQSASSTHISSAIEEVEHVAQEIAEGIHDSTKAVLELSELSHELSVLIEDLKAGVDPDVLVPWTSALATGVKIVDTQHKVLLNLVNKLYVAMKSGQGHAVHQKLLEDLAQYTVMHFDMEEKYFDQFGYPETASHKKIHTELKAQVVDFIEKFKSGQASLSMDLMTFLRDWLVNHIAKTDKRYAKFFLDHGLERA